MHAGMHTSMSAADSSIRVSHETLRELERLRRAFQTRTAEETIQKLIRERRSAALSRVFGSAAGKLDRFRESDRLDSHY